MWTADTFSDWSAYDQGMAFTRIKIDQRFVAANVDQRVVPLDQSA